MAALTTVFAHQGGWDEILFVLAPLALFAGLLLMARKRVAETDPEAEDADAETTGPDTQR